MKVAVIGAGNWGKNLVRNFNALGVLAAVADASAALRESLVREYPGVLVCEDPLPLLESDIPAIAIATPAHTHYHMAKDALLAGKDVFVEKPMTLTACEAEELVALAQDRGRILMVGHLLLYQPAIQWMKAYLESGRLGKLHSLHQERLNLGRVRNVENVLWSFGVHDIAVLLYLVGHLPNRIHATGQAVLQRGIEDDVYLHLEFPGGVHAHLRTSWLWPEKRRSLVVVGSEGMLTYDEGEQTVTLHRKRIGPDMAIRDEGCAVVFQGSGEPLRLELEHFIEAVTGRKPPLTDGANGLEVVRVLEQATSQLTRAGA